MNTTKLSRRSALASGLAFAAPAAAGLPVVAGEHSGNDAELIALGAQLDALYPRIHEAEQAARKSNENFEAELQRRFRPGRMTNEQFEQLWDEVSDKEVFAKARAVQGRADEIFERMMEMPVHTMQGAAMLARATVLRGGLGDYWEVPKRDLDWDKLTIRNLIERVCASGGMPIPETTTSPVEDAELLAMAPRFEALYEQWIDYTVADYLRRKRFRTEIERRTGVPFHEAPTPEPLDQEERAAHPYWGVWHQVYREMNPTDAEDANGDEPRTFMDDLHEMAEEILAHRPTTRAGLRLQVLALASSFEEIWENGDDETATGPAAFLASMASFCDVTWPPYMLPSDQQARVNKDVNEDVKDPATDRERIIECYNQLPPDKARSFYRTMEAIFRSGGRHV